MAKYIHRDDTLNEGRVKLNRAISSANNAEKDASNALEIAKRSDAKSDSTQEQLDQIVIEGDSSIEAAQARVDENGVPHNSLKERIDYGFINVDSRIDELSKNINFITYDSFGVDGRKKFFNPSDGEYYLDDEFTIHYDVDDGVKIKECHEYANEHNLPVLNYSGDYVIRDTRNIEIMTNVEWGHSTFHIDESRSIADGDHVFNIKGENDFFELDSNLFPEILPYLRKGSTEIPTLEDYRNHFAVIFDDTKRIGIRQGSNADNGMTLQEFFYIDEAGELFGEVTWDFDNLTRVLLVECDNNYAVINGGSFLLSGNSDESGEYIKNGFGVFRSRVKIENQFVGLDGPRDESLSSTSGFYYFKDVYDVSLDGSRLLPRISNAGRGTYGIGGHRVLKPIFKNITANGSDDHWGILGMNLVKDMKIEDSDLNRVDVHFHAWNITINNSSIGKRRISLTGGGRLIMNGVTVNSVSYIVFRNDYGAVWDGDIIINDGELIVSGDTETRILNFVPASGDYRRPLIFGHKIHVNNFNFDYRQFPNVNKKARLITFTDEVEFSGVRPIFPYEMDFRNIDVIGRREGCTLLKIEKPNLVRTSKENNYNVIPHSVEVIPNALYRFENVYTHEIIDVPQSTSNYHLFFNVLGSDEYLDKYSLIPHIEFINCKYLSLQPKSSIVKITIDGSIISSLDAYEGGYGRSRIDIKNSELRPNIVDVGDPAYTVGGCEVSLLNSKIYPIKYEGVFNMKDSIEGGLHFFSEKSDGIYVKTHNYLGVKLSRDLMVYLYNNSEYQSKLSDLYSALKCNTRANYEEEFKL